MLHNSSIWFYRKSSVVFTYALRAIFFLFRFVAGIISIVLSLAGLIVCLPLLLLEPVLAKKKGGPWIVLEVMVTPLAGLALILWGIADYIDPLEWMELL